MVTKNGIYLSVDSDNAVRVIIENNTKIQTDKIKISDELIGELEYDLSNYETAVEYISEETEPFKQRNDPLLEEYERAKNRNYKRVERFEDSDGNSNVIRLTFDEYKAWLDKASEMKRLYLQEKVLEEEFRDYIKALDIQSDKLITKM